MMKQRYWLTTVIVVVVVVAVIPLLEHAQRALSALDLWFIGRGIMDSCRAQVMVAFRQGDYVSTVYQLRVLKTFCESSGNGRKHYMSVVRNILAQEGQAPHNGWPTHDLKDPEGILFGLFSRSSDALHGEDRSVEIGRLSEEIAWVIQEASPADSRSFREFYRFLLDQEVAHGSLARAEADLILEKARNMLTQAPNELMCP